MPPEHTFRVNGEQVTVTIAGEVRLLWVLRDILGITGPKYGCGISVCKACTSHLNGRAVTPCTIPVRELGPADEVVTIEGLAATAGRNLHPMQRAWLDHDVAQCGYCQPGQIMTVVALLARVPDPSDEQIDEALRDNVCRCGTYPRIRSAVRKAASLVRGEQ